MTQAITLHTISAKDKISEVEETSYGRLSGEAY